jgi:hypothetical protein
MLCCLCIADFEPEFAHPERDLKDKWLVCIIEQSRRVANPSKKRCLVSSGDTEKKRTREKNWVLREMTQADIRDEGCFSNIRIAK